MESQKPLTEAEARAFMLDWQSAMAPLLARPHCVGLVGVLWLEEKAEGDGKEVKLRISTNAAGPWVDLLREQVVEALQDPSLADPDDA